MKTLIVMIHPQRATAVVHQGWMAVLGDCADYRIHDVYQAYPDGQIVLAQEQALIAAHDAVILQFPLSLVPDVALANPLLAQWQGVFSAPHALFTGRVFALAVSVAGATSESHLQLKRLLLPFAVNALYVNADYRDFFAYYGEETEASPALIAQSAQAYRRFLHELSTLPQGV